MDIPQFPSNEFILADIKERSEKHWAQILEYRETGTVEGWNNSEDEESNQRGIHNHILNRAPVYHPENKWAPIESLADCYDLYNYKWIMRWNDHQRDVKKAEAKKAETSKGKPTEVSGETWAAYTNSRQKHKELQLLTMERWRLAVHVEKVVKAAIAQYVGQHRANKTDVNRIPKPLRSYTAEQLGAIDYAAMTPSPIPLPDLNKVAEEALASFAPPNVVTETQAPNINLDLTPQNDANK